MKVQEEFWEDLDVGRVRRTMGRTITESDIVLHAGQTGDLFPHHMDAAWCATQPFGRRIAHGTLVMSISESDTTELVFEVERVPLKETERELGRFPPGAKPLPKIWTKSPRCSLPTTTSRRRR